MVRQKSRRRKLAVPAGLILIFMALVLIAIRNLSAPAEGTISQKPLSQAELADPHANPGNYTGKYIDLTYPAHYKKVPSAITGSYLEVVSFYATDASGKQIVVGILKENLADDSGIAYRRAHPDLFKAEPRNREGWTIFDGITTSERTAFIQHGPYVASVSATVAGNLDVTADSQTVLYSLKWKQ